MKAGPKWKQWDRDMRKLSTKWDRLTAYGCNLRGKPFDVEACNRARDLYFALSKAQPNYYE